RYVWVEEKQVICLIARACGGLEMENWRCASMAATHSNRSGYSDSTSIIAMDTLNTRRCLRSVSQRRRVVPNVTQTVTLGALTSANSSESTTTACMPPTAGK